MCASVGQLGAGVMDQSLGLGVRIPPGHFVHIASANPSVKRVHDHCLWAHNIMPRVYHSLPTVNTSAVTGPNVVGIRLQ